MNYYHFTAKTLRDGSALPPIGEWLELPANIKLKACPTQHDLAHGFGGLHASAHPYDALQYAPGSLLHLVELDGEVIEHGSPVNKVAARRRKIVATIDAEDLLWQYARKCALSVIHLWDAPDVVKQYLTTGDESLKTAAGAAARAAARAAAGAAAGDAAWDAARDAAGAAAGDAAWAAAWAAQRTIFAELVDAAFAALEAK